MADDSDQAEQTTEQAPDPVASINGMLNVYSHPDVIKRHPHFADLEGVGQKPDWYEDRKFDGDASTWDYAQRAGAAYERRMKDTFPDQAEKIEASRPRFEAAIQQRVKQYAIDKLTDEYKNGLTPVGDRTDSVWNEQHALQATPFLGDAFNAMKGRVDKRAVDAMQSGQATGAAYEQYARMQAEQQVEQERTTGQKIASSFQGISKAASEFALLGKTGVPTVFEDAAGSLAVKALGEKGAATLLGRGATWAAKGLGGATGYSAMQAPLNAYENMVEGKTPKQVGDQIVDNFIDNFAYGQIGAIGKAAEESGLGAKAWGTVKGALKMLVAGELSENAKYAIGQAKNPGAMTTYLNPLSTTAERAQAADRLMTNGGGVLAFEAIKHALGGGGKIKSPQDIADALVAYGLTFPPPEPGKEATSVREQPAKQAGSEVAQPALSTQSPQGKPQQPPGGGQPPTPPTPPTPPREPIPLELLRSTAKAIGIDARGDANAIAKRIRDSGNGVLLRHLDEMHNGPKPEPQPAPRSAAVELDPNEYIQTPKGWLSRRDAAEQGLKTLDDKDPLPAETAEAQESPKTTPEATEPEKPSQERRRPGNAALRANWEKLTDQQRFEAVYGSQVVDLPNKKAFEEMERQSAAKAVAMSDLDDLKAVNDHFSHEAGDTLIRAKAEALKAAGLESYHASGDEFLHRGESREALEAGLQRAGDILRKMPLDFKKKDGSTVKMIGATFGHAVGESRDQADTGLSAVKSARPGKRGEFRSLQQVPDEKTLPQPAQQTRKQIKRAFAAPDADVGTAEEILSHVNAQRKRSGMKPLHLGDVHDALGDMIDRGEVEEHDFGERGTLYSPWSKVEPEIEAGKKELYERTQALLNKAVQAEQESVNGDIGRGERNGGEPASVRRTLQRELQEATAKAGASAQAEEARQSAHQRAEGIPEVRGAEARGGAGVPGPAGSGGEAGSHELSQEAISARADDNQRLEKERIADLNAIRRDVWSRLKEFGVRAIDYNKRFEDASKVPGLDEAAGYWAEKRPDIFKRPGEEPGDRLHDLMRGGMLEAHDRQWHLQNAEQELAGELTPEERNGLAKDFQRAGFTAADAEEHARNIEAEVAREAAREEEIERAAERHRAVTGREQPGAAAPGSAIHEGAPGVAFRTPESGVAGRIRGAVTRLIGEESAAINLKAFRDFFGMGGEEEEAGPTGIKNVVAGQERAIARLPPVAQPSPVGHSYPELRDKVAAIAKDEPTKIDNLVDSLKKKPRAVDDLEDAMLLHRQNDIRNEYGTAMHKLLEARRSGDALDVTAAQTHEQQVRDRLEEITDITKKVGTIGARGLAARRMMVNQDFSLANMYMQFRAAKGGAPLTPDEEASVAVKHATIQKVEVTRTEAESALVQEGKGAAGDTYTAMVKAQAASERAKSDWRDMMARARQAGQPIGRRMMDFLDKLRRAEVISSPVTLMKIMAASGERLAITPIEEGIGSVLSRLPILSKIAAMAPREGKGFTGATEAKAVVSGWVDGVKDAWQTVKTGGSELDTLYGSKSTPRSWLDFVGELHAAAKAPPVRAEFTRSLLQRIDNAATSGKDFTSPAALHQFAVEAYKDSQAAKFQQQNWLAQGIRRFLTPGKDASVGERAFKFAGRQLMPVVTVPTNIVAEGLTYATGAVTGSIRAGVAVAKGLENLKPAEADLIMRSLKKGVFGGAMLTLGFLNPDFVGGFYSGKRKKDDVEPGGIGNVPASLLHHPAFLPLQAGASIRRSWDGIMKKGGTGDVMAFASSLGSAGRGIAEEVPLMREASDLGTKAMNVNAKVRGQYFGELAKSLAVPQLVQWMAGRSDTTTGNPLTGEPVKRQPQGVSEHIMMGIPGLRQQVGAPVSKRRR